MVSSIPPDLRDTIERQTSATIVGERARGGGGASRHGAEVTLCDGQGAEQACYLAWDPRAGDPRRMPFFERETAVLSALSGPFANSGVKIAPLVAADPAHLALCSEYIEGHDRFPDAPDKSTLARDFVGQLARLHALDARHPSFAALGDPGEPTSTTIRQRLEQLSRDNLAAGPDPILQLALRWLAGNIPADRGPPVVLHGDAGPGNFLYRDGRVVALVDWELAHLGDPMEDLAQIWVRSLIQPFVPMREVFSAYEAVSGTSVDLARVKYHRLYFQLGFMVAGHVAQANTGGAATGTAMLYGTMHRRIVIESLAELSGTLPDQIALPHCPTGPRDAGFATALEDLRAEIVPKLTDQRAAAKAKSLARMIKFWRRRDRYGAAFDAAELAELDGALEVSHDDLNLARVELGRAIEDDRTGFAQALQLCHARTVRETFLMADAMGALATTRYEEIS